MFGGLVRQGRQATGTETLIFSLAMIAVIVAVLFAPWP